MDLEPTSEEREEAGQEADELIASFSQFIADKIGCAMHLGKIDAVITALERVLSQADFNRRLEKIIPDHLQACERKVLLAGIENPEIAEAYREWSRDFPYNLRRTVDLFMAFPLGTVLSINDLALEGGKRTPPVRKTEISSLLLASYLHWNTIYKGVPFRIIKAYDHIEMPSPKFPGRMIKRRICKFKMVYPSDEILEESGNE